MNKKNRHFRVRLLGRFGLIGAMASAGFLPNAHADATVECNVNAGFPASTTECGLSSVASGMFSTAVGSSVNATGDRSTASKELASAETPW